MPTTTVSDTEINCPSDIINSLRRGLIILELLATEPEGLLAKTVGFRTGLNLSTCYHLLNTLVAAGYVIKQPETQRFALTGKVSFPGYTSLEQARLVPQLLPHLNALREITSETAYLSVRQGDEIVVSAIVESPMALRVSLLHVGFSGAAHAMALGKAILAYLPERDVSAYLARFGMPALTQKTIADGETLISELTTVAQQGYSVDLEEFAPGVCCIGAPIFGIAGRIVGSLAISLPKSRYDSGSATLIEQVVATANAATRALTVLCYTAPKEAKSPSALGARRQYPVLSHR
jgi:IclR family acetate operon transcriptional repressor